MHSTNLAIYLAVAHEFLSVDTLPNRPSLTSFLDILHSDQPLCSSRRVVENIINFCKAIVSFEHRRPTQSNHLVEVAMNLPVTHVVAGFTEGISHTIPVPAIVAQLLTGDADDTYDTDEFYHILDLIDLYVSSLGNRDSLVLWDSLTTRSVDLTDRKPIIKNRFFIPVMHPGYNSFGHWRLIDKIVNIKMKPEEFGKAAKSLTAPIFSRQESLDSDGVLKYRLHPRHNWNHVRTAWKIIKPLRRRRQSSESEAEKDQRSWPGAKKTKSSRDYSFKEGRDYDIPAPKRARR